VDVGTGFGLTKTLRDSGGILNQMIMKHWYKNASYALRPDADPVKGFAYMMEKYADTAEALAHQKPVVYYIVDA